MGTRIADTILAIVNGSLAVAFVQALPAGVMYATLGVPAAVVWAGATFIVALIPVFGTFMVLGPVALFLVLTGSWLKAIILVAWGGLAVGTIDNLLYPRLVRRPTPPAHRSYLLLLATETGHGKLVDAGVVALSSTMIR